MAKIKKIIKKTKQAKRWIGSGGVILIFFLIIAAWFYPLSKAQSLKKQLLNNPQDLNSQLELIEIFLENHQFNEAEKMLLLVSEKQNNNQIKKLWQQKHLTDPKDIKKLINFWEKIVAEKPNYRDGYLQLAILNYKIWQNEKAKENLKKALIIDPNFEPALALKQIISLP